MPENLILYVSGPMRGYPDTNFPAFDECRDYLLSIGHSPISPADHDRVIDPICETRSGFAEGELDSESPLDFHKLMEWDLRAVIKAHGIVLLPGWERSSGAGHELNAARATGKRVFYYYPRGRSGTTLKPWLKEEEPATIIGLSGYAQAGKDTAALTLTGGAGFVRCAFADTLRDMLYALNPSASVKTGPSIVDFEWADVQRIVDHNGWEWAKKHTEVRHLLQRLGTEAGRQILGDDIWVRTAMAKVKPGGRYVFTDVRFPNEAKAIKDAGGQVWRVERHGCAPVNAHPSETALDDWPFDYVIFNGGTKEELAEQVGHLIHPQRYITG